MFKNTKISGQKTTDYFIIGYQKTLWYLHKYF